MSDINKRENQGYNGSAWENLKSTDGKLRVIDQTYGQAVAEGDIANHEPFKKDGYNDALSSSSEDLWVVGGVYVYPTAEMQMEVVSSSTSDASAGTGVQTVRIYYLDSAYAEHEEVVTLNGQTPVATTATDIFRVQSFRAETVGTNGSAVGTIDIRNLADTPIYARMSIGMTRARQIFYTVPADKALYITDVLLSCGANVSGRPVRFITRAKYDNKALASRDFFVGYTEVILEDSAIDIHLTFPTRFPAGVDIKVSAISPDGASYGAVTLIGWLETA